MPFPELNENRRKMARLPAGAEPLVNPIGGAPGVLCRSGDTRIVSLPGVPGELKAIVDESLGLLVAEVFGDAHYEERSLEVELQDESAIADILRAAEAEHPAVYVKSRAKVLGSTRVLQITLSGRGENRRRSRRAAGAGDGAAAGADRRRRLHRAARASPPRTRTTDARARGQRVRATPPARASSGPSTSSTGTGASSGSVRLGRLSSVVFAPRGMFEWMIGAACAGTRWSSAGWAAARAGARAESRRRPGR